MCTVIKKNNVLQLFYNISFTSFSVFLVWSNKRICTKYLCKIALLMMFFSLFKDDQVSAKHMSRATLSHFAVNFVVYTSRFKKRACTNIV